MSYTLFVAGGTGGHMFPAAAVAQKMLDEGERVRFITDKRGASYLCKDSDQDVYDLSTLGRRSWSNMIFAVFQMAVLALGTLKLFLMNRPKVIVGFGGYVAYPALVLAKVLRIPYVLHEQNSVMGRVNRMFQNGAWAVMTSFPKTQHAQARTVLTGLPVRPQIIKARNVPYTVDEGVFRLVVLGGSQGASVFSTLLPQAFEMLSDSLRERLYVVHQCPANQKDEIEEAYKKLKIHADVKPFIDNIGQEVSKAQFVIMRSGASSVCEVAAMGRPALMVPYPYAMDNHQYFNAMFLSEGQAGWIKAQQDLKPKELAMFLSDLMKNPDVLQRAAAQMKMRGRTKATEDIVTIIKKVA